LLFCSIKFDQFFSFTHFVFVF
jgi:hypothetical protein